MQLGNDASDASTLVGWRKSSYSGGSNGNCLEVSAAYSSLVPVRDSKDPQGPALVFDAVAWSAFVGAVRRGEFA
ncbi:DUF397 domain-containing protein [Streptomyces sp. AC536]|uniref:DUF397 domain-containing protein n=1 Tax=Streptomyces buecherae TaxID=2763006 RepID=UPI00164E3372|nr:DUF397 domain-containing protein [Streptomyces buecherae]MBC3985321.1 DUF397 domain-containing protein [Streptomyces buecherae]QNJ41397.1 DUF397 domain-containing protein [Streptomyces buecherae]